MTVTINGTSGLATDSTSAVVEAVSLNHPSSSTAAITMDASNNVTLASNLTMTGGVYLGGTGSANLLDDVETGSWTPTLHFGGSTTGITYATQSGSYTKIGDAVRISAYINLSNVGTATGLADIQGLPFGVGAGLANLGALSFHLNGVGFNGYFNGWCVNSTSKIQLGTTTDAGSFSFVTNTSFNNNSGIILSGIYKTDA